MISARLTSTAEDTFVWRNPTSHEDMQKRSDRLADFARTCQDHKAISIPKNVYRVYIPSTSGKHISILISQQAGEHSRWSRKKEGEADLLQFPWFLLQVDRLRAPTTPTTSNAVPAPTSPGIYRYQELSSSSILAS